MAKVKYRIDNGQVFDRLVRQKVADIKLSQETEAELNRIQNRANAALKQASHNRKILGENFYEREIFRQTEKLAKEADGKNPALSKKLYEQAEDAAREAVALKYRLRLLQIEQAAQRLQLKTLSKEAQNSPYSNAARTKEKGASLKIRARVHYKKHYRNFVKRELKKMSNDQIQTKQDRMLFLEKAQNNVLTRLNKRMQRIDRVTEKLHQRQIKDAKKIEKKTFRIKR